MAKSVSQTRIKTPKGSVITKRNPDGTTMSRLEWNPDFVQHWGGNYSAAQVWMDSQVLRLSDPYVPFLVGALKTSGMLGTVIGTGIVEYIAPYSRAQYYRARQTDREQREGGMRGPMWFERMKQVHKHYLIDGAQKRAGRGRV